MASRELSILVKALGAAKAARELGKVDKAARGIGNAGKLVAAGVGAAAGLGAIVIGRGIRSGIESLAELEDATTSVDGAIATLGLTGQVTSAQIATWANEIEAATEAAFDDKAITSATETLLRYGKVTPKNIRPAMEVMTDLAARTGSVESASSLLAKALADPAKAAGKLARSGVILTKEQQKQIKAMTEAGDVAGAQAFLLEELAKTTEGAAKASAGPYRDSMNILADVTEDAQRALGEGFMPVITEVRDILTKELGKPETMTNIREFGKGLAGGLRSLIDIARGLPWDVIGTSLKTAGTGAKAVLDAFLGLPSWVQGAVVTGWGLNKLSGGLVGELAKGVIKGVLGMTAGVVNINAGVVNGAGGVPGAVGGAGGRLGGLAGNAAAIAGPAAVLAGGMLTLQDIQSGTEEGVERGARAAMTGFPGMIGRAVTEAIGDPIGDYLNSPPKAPRDITKVKPQGMSPDERQALADISRKGTAQTTAIERTKAAIDWRGQQTVAAIRGIKLNVNVSVPVSVSVQGTTAATTWLSRATRLTNAGIY